MNFMRGLGQLTAEMVTILMSGVNEFNAGFEKGLKQVKKARELSKDEEKKDEEK